jgi:predicted nucleic acid-binding protein
VSCRSTSPGAGLGKADGTAAGRPRSVLDMMIAETAAANGSVVVTDNERHVPELIEMINPTRA